MASNVVDLYLSAFVLSGLFLLAVTISQLTWHCFATTYNNGGSSASHASTRGNCLTTASDLDWSVWLQTFQLGPTGLCFDSPGTDQTENTTSHNSSIAT
jgi:hypothetical protein